MSKKTNNTLFTRKSSRSPTLSKVAMERMQKEINEAPPVKTEKEREERDAKIIMKHLRSQRGSGVAFTGRGRGQKIDLKGNRKYKREN
tara:strand:+ start:1534 stop:1797 length:264 start_codon:yes stop_codon:yes gene_type:complete